MFCLNRQLQSNQMIETQTFIEVIRPQPPPLTNAEVEAHIFLCRSFNILTRWWLFISNTWCLSFIPFPSQVFVPDFHNDPGDWYVPVKSFLLSTFQPVRVFLSLNFHFPTFSFPWIWILSFRIHFARLAGGLAVLTHFHWIKNLPLRASHWSALLFSAFWLASREMSSYLFHSICVHTKHQPTEINIQNKYVQYFTENLYSTFTDILIQYYRRVLPP